MDALLKICPTYLNTPKFCNLAVSLLTVLKNVTMEPSTLDVSPLFNINGDFLGFVFKSRSRQKAFEVEYV